MQDDSSSEAENQKPLSEDDSGEDLDLERPPAAESGAVSYTHLTLPTNREV